MILETLWFYFGQLGSSGATGVPTGATFFLLVPAGAERDFPRPGHGCLEVVEGGCWPCGVKELFPELVKVRCPARCLGHDLQRGHFIGQSAGDRPRGHFFTVHLQLPEVLRNSLSPLAAASDRPRVSLGNT